MKIKQYHWGVIYLFLLIISALLVWLNQHSVNAYWQQTYHRPSYLQKLDDYPLWRKGGELKAWLLNELPEIESAEVIEEAEEAVESEQPLIFLPQEAPKPQEQKYKPAFGEPFIQGALSRLGYELEQHGTAHEPLSNPKFNTSFSTLNSASFIAFEQAVHPNAIFANLAGIEQATENVQSENQETDTALPSAQEIGDNDTQAVETKAENANEAEAATPSEVAQPSPAVQTYPDKIRLSKQDMVFFAGDSLMQGVAPYVQQWLTANGMKSLNLSKQSTGLSYPKFFNWPVTIEETLQKNPEIRLLVIFLGPNDPWDIPHPEKPKSKYLRFKEAEWESVYRQRISHILETARKFNVNVIWLQIPHMRAPKLNTQMAYLNEVLETETHNRALFIPIKAVLSGGKNEYRESILIDGKEMRVRSKDGIHFTPSGMKLIANHIIQHIELNP